MTAARSPATNCAGRGASREQHVEDGSADILRIPAQGIFQVAPKSGGLLVGVGPNEILDALHTAVLVWVSGYAWILWRAGHPVWQPVGLLWQRLGVAMLEASLAIVRRVDEALVPRVLGEGGVHVVVEGQGARTAPRLGLSDSQGP
eukprot:UN4317